MAAIWLMVAAISLFLRRRLGGLTGDTYGAIGETSEVAFLFFILIYFAVRVFLG
jgi:cobalamin synthase